MKNEISIQECRFFDVLFKADGKWLTSKEIAEKANISGRTARMLNLRYAKLGISELVNVFPAHRYRLLKSSPKGIDYLRKVKNACEIFGINFEGDL